MGFFHDLFRIAIEETNDTLQTDNQLDIELDQAPNNDIYADKNVLDFSTVLEE